MYEIVWECVRGSFELFYNFLRSASFKDGVSFWDMILVMFVGGGIVKAIFSAFGGHGLAGSGSATIDAYKSRARSNHTNKENE